MAAKKGGVSTFIYLVLYFLCFGTSPAGRMAFANREKQDGQVSVNMAAAKLTMNPPLANHHTQSNRKAGPQHLKVTRASLAIPGQVKGNGTRTWCIAKPSTSQEKLDDIIQYCCTQPKVDCQVIQAGGMCYLPPNKISDASVVMNIYYNINGKHPFNCYFKGIGLIVTEDPSVGKCIYQV